MARTALPKAHVLFIRFILLGYFGVLCLVAVANFGIFTPNWPFELFASFSRHLLILSPIMGLLFLLFWRKQTLVFLVAALTAFWPLATFSKYENPTHDSCQQKQCLNILSANLRGRGKALIRLAKIASEQNVDIIGIYELPDAISESQLKTLFPDYTDFYVVSHTPEGQRLGSIIAIISRKKLSHRKVLATKTTPNSFWPRAFVYGEIETSNGQQLKVFAGHPRLPLSRASMAQRKELLQELKNNVGTSQNFIIMGDFNLTPWTPAFRKLPGKRAGDPRLQSTWDAERPWLGIPIDHIMVGEDFEMVEAETLPTIGSDHRPISATIAFRD